MPRALGLLLAVAGLALAGAVAPAVARPRPPRLPGLKAPALPGPSGMTLGFVDYPMFMQSPPPLQSYWLGQAHALGSRFIRLSADWYDIAPLVRPRRFNGTNPRSRGYNWTSLDEDVEAAAAHNQEVVMMAWQAPSWAEGRGAPPQFRGIWLPNAAQFGAFGHALAVRYSGRFPDPRHRGRKLPRVRYFQAWNEPNLPNYLLPQWELVGRNWVPVSPRIYRSLLNAFYGGVKSARRDAFVMSAGTGPYGDPPATGQGRMRPVTFLEGLFCLTPSLRPTGGCRNPPHLDGLDHHPYAIGPTVKAHDPGDISVPDLFKINRISRAAARYGHVFPAGTKPLWVTEIDWTSGGQGASPSLQAQDLAAAMYEFWRQGITHVFWFELRDPPPAQTNSFATAGLYYSNGVPKLAAAAYRFPFAAVLIPHRKHYATALWGRAPIRGVVTIEKLVGTRWRRIARARTTAGGIFYTVRSVHVPVELRAVIGREVSPVYVTHF
jgi:hypothetical protein